jgi:hypothetical protein
MFATKGAEDLGHTRLMEERELDGQKDVHNPIAIA